MTIGVFVQKIVNTIERMKLIPPTVLDYVSLRITIGKLREVSESKEIRLTAEEDKILRDLAIERLMNDDGRLVLDLCSIIANCGISQSTVQMESGLTVDNWHRRTDRPHPFEILVSILAETGVFEPDERPLYYEMGYMGIGRTSGRKGAIILTDKRILCVGFFSGFMGISDRIYYEDWVRQPWVSSLDYVFLNLLQDITSTRWEIRARYLTKYVTMEEKSIGAGLYMFHFIPFSSKELREGPIDLHIALDDMRGYNAVLDHLIPPNYCTNRLKELTRRIRALIPPSCDL